MECLTSFSWLLRRPLGLLVPGSNQGLWWCVFISLVLDTLLTAVSGAATSHPLPLSNDICSPTCDFCHARSRAGYSPTLSQASNENIKTSQPKI